MEKSRTVGLEAQVWKTCALVCTWPYSTHISRAQLTAQNKCWQIRVSGWFPCGPFTKDFTTSETDRRGSFSLSAVCLTSEIKWTFSRCLTVCGVDDTQRIILTNFNTHFICFTIVLFPDSPAPRREDKVQQNKAMVFTAIKGYSTKSTMKN